MPHLIDITGQRFGSLTALEKISRLGSKKTFWKCSCDCGRVGIFRADELRAETSRCECSYAYKNFRRRNTISDSVRLEIVSQYMDGCGSYILGRKFGISPDSVQRICKDAGLPPRSYKDAAHRYAFDANYFNEIDSSDKAYWLGFITADGNVQGTCLRISLGIKDLHHLEKFKASLNSPHKICIEPKYKRCSFGVRSDKIVSDLYNLGIMERKSLIVRPCMQIPKEFQRDYWRGVIDGDGNIRLGNRMTIGLCGTFEMVNGFRDYLLSCGFVVKARVLRLGNIFRFYVGTQAMEIYNHLYSHAETYLDRKYHMELI